MAPFTAWLPRRVDPAPDLVVKVAGRESAVTDRGMTALGQVLAERGFAVLSQARRLEGDGALSAVRLRVSSDPISSTGNGCDVLAYVERRAPTGNPFGLQAGAVVVSETGGGEEPVSVVPGGVIHYAVPFTDLHRRCGARFPGKGLIAVGVLTHLLGVAAEAIRLRVGNGLHRRYFEAGLRFASEHLVKRDVTALPEAAAGRRRVLIGLPHAVQLGLAGGTCDCGRACVELLRRSPDGWLAEHVATRRRLPNPGGSGGSEGIRLCSGSADPTAVAVSDDRSTPLVLVAADLPDLIGLLRTARRLARGRASAVWVVADELLAGRHEGVPGDELGRFVEEAGGAPDATEADGLPAAGREGDLPADVGYVSWGSAQGVVRDAVALCRSFGLHVAALYPKVLRPVPVAELEAFASGVRRVVVVEPTGAGRYTDLVRSRTGLRPSTIMPEPGRALTPMDLFLREGLGT